MEKVILNGIVNIINENKELLGIPLRQKAKFEGWLKFELAFYLEKIGLESVEVESPVGEKRERTDITFICNGKPYSIELKTSNTNWRIEGVNPMGRPITKNIKSIIHDVNKLKTDNGIVAFVLFPIPVGDSRWESYLRRITESTGVALDKERNCRIVTINIDEKNSCDMIVCVFTSK